MSYMWMLMNVKYFDAAIRIFLLCTTSYQQNPSYSFTEWCILQITDFSHFSDFDPFHWPADAADEALRVVRPAQGGHHLPGDVLVTAVALGAVEALVVLGADVLAGVVEETRMHQITAAYCTYRHTEREKDRKQNLIRWIKQITAARPKREKNAVQDCVDCAATVGKHCWQVSGWKPAQQRRWDVKLC